MEKRREKGLTTGIVAKLRLVITWLSTNTHSL